MAKGEHIYVASSAGGIPFQHHGIDMGDGTVVHLAPAEGARVTLRDESNAFSVRRDSYEHFCNGALPRVVKHPDARDGAEVAQAAAEQIGRTGYSLMDGNCEHFATFCATGRAESHQIEMGEATVAAVTSMATKAFWSLSSRLGGRFVLRTGMKIHPAAMLADGVEVAVLAVSCRRGMSAEQSRRFARVSGTMAAAGIGCIVAGPAGAAVCVAAHTSSGALADQFCKSVRRVLT